MKNIILFCGLLFLNFSFGCQINPTDVQINRYRTVKTEPINISIDNKFASLIDRSGYMGDTITFPTGRIASEIFNGDPNEEWKIELVSSQLNVEWRDEFPIPICHYSANYNISCILTGPKIKLPLTSNRISHKDTNFIQPTTISICGALDDIASQTRVLMQLSNKTKNPL